MWAIVLMAALSGCLILFVAMKKSAKAKESWLPKPSELNKHKVDAVSLIHDAHTSYASAKQEENFTKALVRCSYGLAQIRAVQAIAKLDDIKGVHLPANINGPVGLLDVLAKQQRSLMIAVESGSGRTRKKVVSAGAGGGGTAASASENQPGRRMEDEDDVEKRAPAQLHKRIGAVTGESRKRGGGKRGGGNFFTRV